MTGPGSESRTNSTIRQEIEAWIRPLLPNLGQVLLATVLLQAATLIFPLANQVLVDHILLPRQRGWLLALGLGLLAALLAQTVLGYVRGWVLQGLQLRLDHHLMTRFLFHQLRLPLSYFKRTPSGEVFQRLRTVGQLTDLLSWRTTSEVLDVFLLLGYLVIMAFYSVKLTVLVLLQAVLRIALILPLRPRIRTLAREEQRAREKASGSLLEILSSLETLQASGGQSAALAHYRDPLTRRIAAKFQWRSLNFSVSKALTAVGGLSQAMNFWVGGQEVLQDKMTLGALLTFMALQRLFSEPLEGKVEALSRFQVMGAAMERLDEGFREKEAPQGTVPTPPLTGAIRLENVSFRFDANGPWILRNISINIRPGEKVALVGLSGAGKSTLARLLLGIYRPTEGSIFYDDLDLMNLEMASFRRQVGVVLQDGFLFQESLRWNLSLQHPGASAAELTEATRRASIQEAISRLPLGLDQVLGREGWAMSGGEQQRLMLARALVGPPRILLLDEATSALDLETEAKVHHNLGDIGCTRVLVAHRLATVRDADRILVLEQGRIAQEGHYRDLETRPGLFQDLVRAMEAHHV